MNPTTANGANDPSDNTHENDELLTLKEAGALVRKSEDTMRYYRHLGTGPRSFRIGRRIYYWKTDVIVWLLEQSNAPDGRYDGAHARARSQDQSDRRNREAG